MEVVVALVIFGGLLGLAARFGYDSRDAYRSDEEQFALWGVRWERDSQPRPPQPTSRVRRARARLAESVIWLANWLDPTVVVSPS